MELKAFAQSHSDETHAAAVSLTFLGAANECLDSSESGDEGNDGLGTTSAPPELFRRQRRSHTEPASALWDAGPSPKLDCPPPGLKPPHGMLSIGSALHGTGNCKPCAWFWKPGSCQNAESCRHCHLCPEGEIKQRRKTKDATRLGLATPKAAARAQVQAPCDARGGSTFKVCDAETLPDSKPSAKGEGNDHLYEKKSPKVIHSLLVRFDGDEGEDKASASIGPISLPFDGTKSCPPRILRRVGRRRTEPVKLMWGGVEHIPGDDVDDQDSTAASLKGESDSLVPNSGGHCSSNLLPVGDAIDVLAPETRYVNLLPLLTPGNMFVPPGLKPPPGTPSHGSLLHATGHCRPCAWFWKPGGCQNQEDCRHCHLCPQDTIRKRKNMKTTMLRLGLATPKSAVLQPIENSELPSFHVDQDSTTCSGSEQDASHDHSSGHDSE